MKITYPYSPSYNLYAPSFYNGAFCLETILYVYWYCADILLYFHFREIQSLEKATASVIFGLVARGDYDILSSYHMTLHSFLCQMAPIFDSNGLSRLQTTEVKSAISALLCEIQDKLSPQYLLSSTCMSERKQLVAALVGGIGAGAQLQVSILFLACNVYFVRHDSSRLELYVFS